MDRRKLRILHDSLRNVTTLFVSKVPHVVVQVETKAGKDPNAYFEGALQWPALRELSLRRCSIDDSSLFSWGAPVQGDVSHGYGPAVAAREATERCGDVVRMHRFQSVRHELTIAPLTCMARRT